MNTRIEKLEDFLKDNPGNALLQYSLGVEYLKIGQPERAIASLRAAIAAKTDYSAAYRELGKAMGQAGLSGSRGHIPPRNSNRTDKRRFANGQRDACVLEAAHRRSLDGRGRVLRVKTEEPRKRKAAWIPKS